MTQAQYDEYVKDLETKINYSISVYLGLTLQQMTDYSGTTHLLFHAQRIANIEDMKMLEAYVAASEGGKKVD